MKRAILMTTATLALVAGCATSENSADEGEPQTASREILTSVPLSAGVNVSDIGFHAPVEDEEPLFSMAPWTATVGADAITWSAPAPNMGAGEEFVPHRDDRDVAGVAHAGSALSVSAVRSANFDAGTVARAIQYPTSQRRIAGPASRNTRAAPGLMPLAIRAAAIGVLAEAHM